MQCFPKLRGLADHLWVFGVDGRPTFIGRWTRVAEQSMKVLCMPGVVANDNGIGGAVANPLLESPPRISATNGNVGENKLDLLYRKSRINPFCLGQTAAHVNRKIPRLQQLGNRRERGVERMDDKNDRLGHSALFL